MNKNHLNGDKLQDIGCTTKYDFSQSGLELFLVLSANCKVLIERVLKKLTKKYGVYKVCVCVCVGLERECDYD